MPDEGAPPPQLRDVVVVGGSAGGVEAALRLLQALPAALDAAVFVVIHRGAERPQLLAEVLASASALPVSIASEGERFSSGHVYVAPVDRHLLVGNDHLHVRRGPRENQMRPAIDPLFRSAAANCTTRVIGVLLSGLLDDGTAGLHAIKRCGGLALVQDPRDALFPDMPRSAIGHVDIDHIASAPELANLIVDRLPGARPPAVEVPDQIRIEALIAAQELTVMPDRAPFGTLSPLTCPECHGVMYEIREGNLVRFRCHTGHAYTLDSMSAAQTEAWEVALYNALRTQREHVLVARRLADHARYNNHHRSADELDRRAVSYEEGAELIRQLLSETGADMAEASEVAVVPNDKDHDVTFRTHMHPKAGRPEEPLPTWAAPIGSMRAARAVTNLLVASRYDRLAWTGRATVSEK